MSLQKFNDNCPGCRPVLLDPKTMRPLPPESREMQAINLVWGQTTREERAAFHAFTCLNSRDPIDLFIVGQITKRIETALTNQNLL